MKRLLLLILLGTSLFTFGQIPTNGLVAYYPFNGNANDESTNSNNGTVNGATLTTDRFGNSNGAYSFDGIDDKIIIQNAEIQNSFPMTISLWFKTSESFSKNHSIIGKYECKSYNGYSILINSQGTASSYYYNNTSNNVTSNTSIKINDGEWHSLVTVYDETGLKYYIDDSLVVESKFNGIAQKITTNTDLSFGFYPKGICESDKYIKGSIDDVAIYNRALTPTEVSALYNESVCYQKVVEKITVTDTLRIKLNVVTGIDHKNIDSEIKVYPNPATDKINVSITDASVLNNYKLELRNTTSALLWKQTINTSNYSIDVSSLEGKGLYFLNIFKDNGELIDVRKIILE